MNFRIVLEQQIEELQKLQEVYTGKSIANYHKEIIEIAEEIRLVIETINSLPTTGK